MGKAESNLEPKVVVAVRDADLNRPGQIFQERYEWFNSAQSLAENYIVQAFVDFLDQRSFYPAEVKNPLIVASFRMSFSSLFDQQQQKQAFKAYKTAQALTIARLREENDKIINQFDGKFSQTNFLNQSKSADYIWIYKDLLKNKLPLSRKEYVFTDRLFSDYVDNDELCALVSFDNLFSQPPERLLADPNAKKLFSLALNKKSQKKLQTLLDLNLTLRACQAANQLFEENKHLADQEFIAEFLFRMPNKIEEIIEKEGFVDLETYFINRWADGLP